jgi:hypothetical protein
MGFEAAGLVGFVAVNIVVQECDVDIVGEDVEHQDRIAVGIFHLFRNLAVDGGGESTVVFGENDLQKLGEGFVQVGNGGFFECPKEGGIDGRHFALEFKWFFEGVPVSFCPSADLGYAGQLGDESE